MSAIPSQVAVLTADLRRLYKMEDAVVQIRGYLRDPIDSRDDAVAMLERIKGMVANPCENGHVGEKLDTEVLNKAGGVWAGTYRCSACGSNVRDTPAVEAVLGGMAA